MTILISRSVYGVDVPCVHRSVFFSFPAPFFLEKKNNNNKRKKTSCEKWCLGGIYYTPNVLKYFHTVLRDANIVLTSFFLLEVPAKGSSSPQRNKKNAKWRSDVVMRLSVIHP